KAMREQWRSSAVRDFDELKSKELDRIDLLERQYWEAWNANAAAAGRSGVDDDEADPEQGDADTDADMDADGTVGIPSPKAAVFLAGGHKCIERRCKPLGLDSPTKIAPTNPTGTDEYTSLTADALRKLPLAELVRVYRSQMGAPDQAPGKPPPAAP